MEAAVGYPGNGGNFFAGVCLDEDFSPSSTDDNPKDGDQKRSDFYVVFTMMLCGFNFCVW